MANVVVIGAGMGGLATAARLAVLGHRVTVCEQASTVGGKVGTFSRAGFTFDTGPSLLTLPAVYRDLFMKTGPPLEEVVDLVEVDPAWHYRFSDGTWLALPNASRARSRQAFDDTLGAGAGNDWDRLLDRGQLIWQATRGPVLESPLRRRRDLARLTRSPRDLRAVAPWSSLRQLGRSYLRDPRQRMLLDRYATYTGSDPRRAPAALATVPYVEQTFGSWYVRGGLRRLAVAVHDRATQCGAVVRTHCDVEQVLVEGGRAVGVRLVSGERVSADVVVADIDASVLYGAMVPDLRTRPVRQRLRRSAPSSSAFVLMLALRRGTSKMAHHTVLFPADYDAEFDSLFGTSPRPVADPAIYIAVPADPTRQPADSEAWFVLVNAPRSDVVDWSTPTLAENYAQRVLAVMAERGLDVRGRVLWHEIRTPADLERETRSPGGAIYGTSSNGLSAAFRRPANASPVPGLYLVGGSAHPGGGLPLVGMSAAIVAGLIGSA